MAAATRRAATVCPLRGAIPAARAAREILLHAVPQEGERGATASADAADIDERGRLTCRTARAGRASSAIDSSVESTA